MPWSIYRRGRKDDTPPDLFIAVPCNSGRPCANTFISMVNSAAWLEEHKISFDMWVHTEDCHVDDSRNFLCKQFMNSGAKFLIFIDDDVGWETDAFAKLVLHKDADIVGGSYPLKQPKDDFPIRIKKEQYLQARADGLLEVEGMPTGFMRISRKVLEAMYEKRKHMSFLPKEAKPGDEKLTVIFERMIADGHRWSGDLNFCREARLLGFKVWCDPEMEFTHQGQYRWLGHLGNHLRKTNGVLDSRLDAAMEKLLVGDASPETFNDIYKYYNEPYAAGPKMLSEVYHRCLEAKGPILEVGSGITTIIAGIACLRNGQMVHALEHDIEWFRRVKNFIQLWKVRHIALHYVPLREYPEHQVQGRPQPPMWYDLTHDPLGKGEPDKFDVVIIDGPPRRFGRELVYVVMKDRIKDAVWIVDDMDDAGQRALVEKAAEGRKIEITGKQGMRHYAVVT